MVPGEMANHRQRIAAPAVEQKGESSPSQVLSANAKLLAAFDHTSRMSYLATVALSSRAFWQANRPSGLVSTTLH